VELLPGVSNFKTASQKTKERQISLYLIYSSKDSGKTDYMVLLCNYFGVDE
jgi:hypothetical protein